MNKNRKGKKQMSKLNLLLNMLSYKRPSQEKYITGKFIERFLSPLDIKFDGYGNVYKKIGDNNVLYSSHIDTVSETAGFQKTQVIGDYIHLATKYKKQSGNVLGGDCTTGVFIMSEMIKAGIEGLYIFHLDEEIGGAGSQYILDNERELLTGIDIAIAFDRKGNDEIITHQFGRTSSDDFADSLADQLIGYKPSPFGTFTDTQIYSEIIPECTNLSTGYENAHTSKETQSISTCFNLLDMMLTLDIDKLAINRNPLKIDYPSKYWDTSIMSDREYDSLTGMIADNPETASRLLSDFGIGLDEFREEVFEDTGILESNYKFI